MSVLSSRERPTRTESLIEARASTALKISGCLSRYPRHFHFFPFDLYLCALLPLSLLQLDTLNLNKNYIKCIENISHLGRLTTLLLANNRLETADDIRHVLQCPSIQVR